MTSEVIEKEGYLLDVGYRNLPSGSAPYLHFSDADGDGGFSVFDTDFYPYFIVRRSSSTSEDVMEKRLRGLARDNDIKVQGVGHGWKKLHGEPVPVTSLKVSYTGDVKKLRKKAKKLPGAVDVYEADILFANRYIVDKGLTPGRRYRVTFAKDNGHWLREIEEAGDGSDVYLPTADDVLAFDLEMAKEGAFPTADKDPIDLIAVSHKNDNFTIGGHDISERDTIKEFCREVQERDPDIIVSYFGDSFDWPYLIERANKLNIKLALSRDGSEPFIRGASGRQGATNEVSLTGRLAIDILKIVRRDFDKITQEDENGIEINVGKNLENVAEFFGVMKKDERVNLTADQMASVYRDNPDRFRQYAKDDSRATLDISLEVVPQIIALSQILKLPIEETATIDRGKMAENLFIYEASREHEIVPNKQYDNDFDVEGGLVLDPVGGFHDEVTLSDYSSLYPNITKEKGIGPASLVDEDYDGPVSVSPEHGHRFALDKEDFVVKIIDKLMTMKDDINERLDNAEGDKEKQLKNTYIAVKQVLNTSAFGYLLWDSSRWFVEECGEAITDWGRYYTEKAVELIEENGYTVIYGDTDSCFLKKSAVEAPEPEALMKKINQELPITLEVDANFDTLFLLTDTKKRYAGLKEDGGIMVKGLEIVRSDWAPYAQESQATIISTLLKEKDIEEAIEEAKALISRLDNKQVEEEKLLMSSSLGQPLDEYDNKQKHSEAAKRAMDTIPGITYENGDDVPYFVVTLDEDGGITDNTVTLDHYHYGDFEIDYDYYLDRQVCPAIMRLLDVVNVDEDVVRGRPAQQSLEEYL